MIGGTGTALINILFLVILFVVAIAIARVLTEPSRVRRRQPSPSRR